ncbi:MAG: hypothetical protein GXZ02_03840 [Clostridiales bacterium]|nr:hypothetical protein [Clostridiales bacterium]
MDDAQGFIYGLTAGITVAGFEEVAQVPDNYSMAYSTNILGTGTQVNIIDDTTGTTVATYTIIIFGDVNGDGCIDSIDAGILVDHENHTITWDTLIDAAYIKAGDLNGDYNMDSIDASIIVDAENYIATIDQNPFFDNAS